MIEPAQLLRGILAPGVLAGVLLLVLWGLSSAAARRDGAAPPSAAAFAVPAGMLLGWVLLFGWKTIPAESWRWMGWVAVAVAVLGTLAAAERTPARARWALCVGMVVAALFLLLRKRLWPQGGEIQVAKLALYGASAVLAIVLWQATLPRLGAVVGAAVLWLLAAATAAMLLFAGSLVFAQTAGALAGALGALVVACLLRPSPSGMAGAIPGVAVLLASLAWLSIEFSYSDYSPWLYALVGAAPALVLQPLVRRPWLRLALIALPVAVAVGLALRTYQLDG